MNIKHSFIKTNSIEFRKYQINIADSSSKKNTLVVLPTGLGKTIIALILVAKKLRKEKDKILFLAPTKPLVTQHAQFLKQFLTIDDINILSDFNDVEPKQIGEAIQNIVDIFKTRMGNKAGYFFLAEFKEVLGEEYHSIIKEMGVDLRLIDLQKQIYGLDTGKYKIKDEFDSNIAFLEKKEKLNSIFYVYN